MSLRYDAVVVGSGPNGLAAAIRLQQHGCHVLLVEGKDTIGGGTRSESLIQTGVIHDICSAVHPLGIGSPYLRTLPLEEHGLQWIHPDIPVAHPLDDYHAVALHRSIQSTIEQFDSPTDQQHYQSLLEPLSKQWHQLAPDLLAPLGIPRHPFKLARIGWYARYAMTMLLDRYFQTKEARALLSGHAAHSILSLDKPFTTAPAILLMAAGHAVGFPFPRGGANKITQSMANYFTSLGGTISTGNMVADLRELPDATAYLLDITPKQLLELQGTQLPSGYRKKLQSYNYNHGSCKVDMVLSDPIPWNHELCRKAGTVHIGGTAEEIIASEAQIASDPPDRRPYLIVAQHSLFDDRRTPADSALHTGWAYAHVPHGSEKDYTERILDQIERYAPGFRDCIVETHTITAAGFQNYNPNYIGGDINGGRQDFWQLFRRPGKWFNPYQTPQSNLYLCSSATPPGGGVHGMCGFHAAESAIQRHFC
ncbi:MAG: phytoene desaturase family protein [Bacteroidota bacterium]